MQRVDPFIPVSSRRTPSVRPHTAHAASPPQPAERPAGGVDGFVHPRAASLPPQPVTVPSEAPVVPVQQVSRTPLPAKPRRHRLRHALGIIGMVTAVLLAGTVAQTLFVGEILIAGYAVYALVRHVASRTTFMMALLSLLSIMELRMIGKDALLATNFAVYSLLLAFVGVITLAREVRQSKA